MPHRSILPVEPFIERVEPAGTAIETTRYRFGYRVAATKHVVSAVDIPAETVERAVTAGLSLSARITPDGNIAPSLADANGFAVGPSVVWTATPIDELVTEAVGSENLRLEEVEAAELRIFLDRLERSASLVKEALKRLKGTG